MKHLSNECRRAADSQNKGYRRRDKLLVHTGGYIGTDDTQLVLPVERRKTVIEMAHSSLLDGHLETKKTNGELSFYLAWSGERCGHLVQGL